MSHVGTFLYFQDINPRSGSWIMDTDISKSFVYMYSGSDSFTNVPWHVITNCKLLLLSEI